MNKRLNEDGEAFEHWRDRAVRRSLGPAIAQAEGRADALVEATRELMVQSRDGVTVQEIADRAGMSLRLLYRYFESKDELIAAVLADQEQQNAERAESALGPDDEPGATVRALLRSLSDVDRTAAQTHLSASEAQLMQTNPAEMARCHAPVAAVVERVLERAGAEPGSAYLVMAARRAYTWSTLFESSFGLSVPSADRFVDLCLAGLGLDRDGDTA